MMCEQCKVRQARKRFCSNKCKDRFHNTHNPRGLFPRGLTQDEEAHEAGMEAQEAGWDGHKGVF